MKYPLIRNFKWGEKWYRKICKEVENQKFCMDCKQSTSVISILNIDLVRRYKEYKNGVKCIKCHKNRIRKEEVKVNNFRG